MKPALIVGNGSSRLPFDLASFRPFGPIYGCNALYRDFEPDFLIAIDEKIIAEIQASDFPKQKFIIPPVHEQFEPPECNKYSPRSNAGMNAMLEAIKAGHTELFCIGFDFIWDHEVSVSNVYDGSASYTEETRANVNDNLGRIRYLTWIALKNKHVKFYLVYPDQYFAELSFHEINAANVSGLTFTGFRSKIHARGARS